MSETLYSQPINVDTISTGNIAIQTDLLSQWLYLTPNAATANTITAGFSRFCNTYTQNGAFWSNVYSLNSYSQIAVPNNRGGTGTSGGWSGSVVVPDGRVILAPQIPNAVSIGIYNPFTNLFTTVAAGGLGTNYAYALQGTLAPDGRVIFGPFRTTAIGIFNPVTSLFTTTTGGLTANPGHMGSCLLPNGKIMFGPYDNAWIGLFDPVTNLYTTGPTTIGGQAYGGLVPLPDGRVLMPPNYTGTRIGMYDPFTNTYSVVKTGLTAGWYAGSGALLPDGTVAILPNICANIGLYNPMTNSYTTVRINNDVNVSYWGSKVLPNGLLFMGSNGQTPARNGLFNYQTQTFTSVTATGAGTELSQGSCTLLPDGRIIQPPFLNLSNMGVNTGFTCPVPLDYILNPLFNHGG